MATYNRLQFVLPAGGVILVDADLMYVCAVQLGIKLVDDALEYLHHQSDLASIINYHETRASIKMAISMLEEIRMNLAREYDDARRQYQN